MTMFAVPSQTQAPKGLGHGFPRRWRSYQAREILTNVSCIPIYLTHRYESDRLIMWLRDCK